MRLIKVLGLSVAAVLAMVTAAAAPASATNYSVTAWGFNQFGQLGDGFKSASECPVGEACSGTPVTVSGLSGVTAIAGGGLHNVALLSDGTVMAWGDNNYGDLGNGTGFGESNTPLVVPGLSGVTSISAGYNYSLALLSNGKVRAWGWNAKGQLGDGSTTDSSAPVEVAGLEHVIAISAGFGHSLALLEGGRVMAWGNNASGELGNNSTISSDVPVEVSGLGGVTAISAGGFVDGEQSAALLSSGRVMAWGDNEYGQLGDGTTVERHVPVEVSELHGVTAIAAGGLHSLALLGDGTAEAWGWNAKGQLGRGTREGPETCGEPREACSTKPVKVEGLSERVTAISAGWFYSLALRSNHTATTWGWNGYDELGDNSEAEIGSDVPVAVSDALEVAAVAAGGEDALALRPAISPPEYGRCVKVDKGTGEYKSAACDSLATEPASYEWYPGVAKASFTTEGGTPKLESVSGVKITCKSESGTGEYSGPKTVADVVIRFRGCAASEVPCTTVGAAQGEVLTNRLDGVLGIEKRSTEGAIKNKIASALSPAEPGESFAEFSCVFPYTIRGAVLAPVAANAMQLTAQRKYKATIGKQKPEKFEGEPREVLEESIHNLPFEQAGLTMETVQANEESVEINSVA
jgi:alpha-tubulin suppressor-like RCC1 family protein